MDIFASDGEFEVAGADSVQIGDDSYLGDVASHFGGEEDFQVVHVVDAVLIMVHFVNPHILANVKDHWLPQMVFPQVMKDTHLMKLLKIFPFVLANFLFPFQILCNILSRFLQVEIFADVKAADFLLVVVAELLPERMERLEELWWDFATEVVLLAEGGVPIDLDFLLDAILVLQEVALEFLKLKMGPDKCLKKGLVAL